MAATLVEQIKSTLKPSDNPYLQGAWTPTHNEWDAQYKNGDVEVIGQIPHDIEGVYIRTGENQVHEPIGRYHPFDGDGFIHSMSFKNGRASYRSRFVRTKGFEAEKEAGGSIWAGLMEPPHKSKRHGWGAQQWLKDSSSTDVTVHAGKIISTFYQCGEGYRLNPYTLEQFGTEGWVPLDGISAHCKTDENTGELLFFNYSKHAPYMHYGVVGADNKLKHYVPIPLPGPRLPHDMAFTENYAILNDMPLFWAPELLERNIHAAQFYPDMPTRFAIIPRLGQPEDIKWFEAAPTYTLHWLNAYEDGDEIILDGYFQEEPMPKSYIGAPEGLERMMAYLDQILLKPKLHRWRFNMKSGETIEERLDDQILEFGMINQKYAGRKYQYGYSAVPEPGWFLFRGLVKHDLQNGTREEVQFGEGRFGSEAPFVPRINAVDEDDGYIISYIADMNLDRSECVIYDAKKLSQGPVCQIILPERICSGTHSTWANYDSIGMGQNTTIAE
ncbi:apocarotenoid-15,15'-oxygenase [Sphingorhabdus lutea]|uniref:Dioxygenase n=1 Tax=Sphingorhabdus lutea TaxID=1913578 RepID=A0A1L3JEQ6_9SPHN|nr:carotenoid oxygenase family protein [Sphingorhabdus lutea]APG63612.1 apocarotenoid-15,15'-oxygenase [Sphingorhabdus lutea]